MPGYETLITNEKHTIGYKTGNSTITISSSNDPDTIYMCRVSLMNLDQCELDTTALTKGNV